MRCVAISTVVSWYRWKLEMYICAFREKSSVQSGISRVICGVWCSLRAFECCLWGLCVGFGLGAVVSFVVW